MPLWAAIVSPSRSSISTGFRWEAIEHLKAPNGAKVYTLRLNQRIRAVAFRDGDFLRVISLHPDHDSYER